MFSRFTTREGKTLIIRTEDIRGLLDYNDGCNLTWLVGDEARYMTVRGTAAENLAKLLDEREPPGAVISQQRSVLPHQ